MDASLQERVEQLASDFAVEGRTAEDLNGLMRMLMKSATVARARRCKAMWAN